jgi:hypothetical protein
MTVSSTSTSSEVRRVRSVSATLFSSAIASMEEELRSRCMRAACRSYSIMSSSRLKKHEDIKAFSSSNR